MLAKPEEQGAVLLPVQERLKAQLDGIASQSYKKGLEEGRRDLLRRMAARRFGADTARQLDPLLAATEDPKRLIDVGKWITTCATGKELLERVRNGN